MKVVDGKVNRLQEKVKHFQSFSKDAVLLLKVLDEGMSFANSEIESTKEKITHWEKSLQEETARVERKLQGEIKTLRDEKLYMEVYQWRENLRFYGIRVASGATEKNVKEVLVGFMQWIWIWIWISVRQIPLSFKEFIALEGPTLHKVSRDRSLLGFCDILIESW